MRPLKNTPRIKIGVVGVSRDCFPIELARRRLEQVVTECRKICHNIIPCKTIIQTESDAMAAVAEMNERGADAAAIYLGNFGPEGPMTIFARMFGKPFMLCGAAEESKDTLVDGRGDAFCGMLNASLNCGLRNLRAHLPPAPVALPTDIAKMIHHFSAVAGVVIGVKNLRAITFGPRPQDFYACNAPIKPLYDLGVEVMENSELDLLALFHSVANRHRDIKAIARDMATELGDGNQHPEKLLQLAQFELALTTFFEHHLGSRHYGVFANKCWPAFEKAFGFVPCYVNSRLAARGIPVACEVDIYGAVSEYMAQLASLHPVTLLDVNNTVPSNLRIADLKGAEREDLFMGFHCGNTPACCLCKGFSMKHQLIMHRLMEPGKKPNITCGTLEGTLKPGPVTIYRIQATPAGTGLHSYVADGHALDADPFSFGGIGIISIRNFSRFYRHVMLGRQFPHHTATAFKHVGRVLYDATKLLGVDSVWTPRSTGNLYPDENPFAE